MYTIIKIQKHLSPRVQKFLIVELEKGNYPFEAPFGYIHTDKGMRPGLHTAPIIVAIYDAYLDAIVF